MTETPDSPAAPHGHQHNHQHGHHHDHDHAKTLQPDLPEPTEEWEFLEIALRELLIEKGLLSARAIQDKIEEWDHRTPHNGAEVVARAWVDPAYKDRLLSDGNTAVAELGYPFEGLKLVVAENTPELHHMVVCTLCSCYPRQLLGIPPLWYKSRAYRARTVREPRAVLAEFGTLLPEDTEVRVLDSTADCRYLVVPMRPQGTEGMSEAELAGLVTRDSMIGTAQALTPEGGRAAGGI
ncbi:nitrile hydratase subunit alpha [Algihabitans albus]|uniref:nitrile hydratase subunit alpha n=1 Tax=Algihabitans albus TaxID=2164067 RepID=UPI001F290608|nr:nitrile hydratase subunit alpha [Algihabitans albus]